jgi:hypothetical protein
MPATNLVSSSRTLYYLWENKERCSMSLSPKQLDRLEKAKLANAHAFALRVSSYREDPSFCKRCKIVLEYRKRNDTFCSKSCSASHNNQGVQRNLVDGVASMKVCEQCGSPTSNYRFCKVQCYSDHCTQEKVRAFLESGMVWGNPASIKKLLVRMRGHSCELCHTQTWRGQAVPLVLDHINGVPSDSRLSNVRLVCGNCNMQLPTFAGKNKGKGGGRPYRNKRYQDGLSY